MDGPVFGGLFADDDVECGTDGQRDDESDGVARIGVGQERLKHAGDDRLREGAEAEAGEGDADLAGGEVEAEAALDVAAHAVDHARGRAGCGIVFTETGGASADGSELGGDEESIDRNKRKGGEDAPKDCHVWRGILWGEGANVKFAGDGLAWAG